MEYITFCPNKFKFNIVVLSSDINSEEIEKHYIEPIKSYKNEFIAFKINTQKKTLKSKIQKQLEEIYSKAHHVNAKYIIVTNADFFKIMVGKNDKIDKYYGYIIKAKDTDINIIYMPNHKTLFYNPANKDIINLGLKALQDHIEDNYNDLGNNIKKYYEIVEGQNNISKWLNHLKRLNQPLTTDIETFSLKHYDSGIASITLCWSKNEGIVIPVDIVDDNNKIIKQKNQQTRDQLKNFFIYSKNKFIWHNAAFDIYILIYQLFMKDELDTEGLLFGLEVMLKNYEDTQLIAYLALNSCTEYKLSLKSLAHEFSGNYAIENINDITKLPYDKLLEYNYIDGLSTYYVYNKYYPIMVQDEQLDFYTNIFKPALKDNIQMQLTGLPVNMDTVLKVEKELNQKKEESLNLINSFPLVQNINIKMKEQWVIDKNNSLKKKRVNIDDVPSNVKFNLNSPNQLIYLLYNELYMNLPIIEHTDKGNPATGKDVLESLINHTSNQQYKDILNALIDFKLVDKLLTTFIPAFKNARKCNDGWHYLYGNFKLGGAVSGRLSSHNINLQQLPSKGNKYAKIIKTCFEAPPNYLLVGLDYDSLEDKISALTTKDPNKLDVYIKGYDGHSYRAYYYFKDQITGIIENNVQSINSIKKLYPDLRQNSKEPTFALTYLAQIPTLVKKCGFSLKQATSIYNTYQELYKVSVEYIEAKLKQACKDGYVTLAFGLRLRTPILKQTILNTKVTPAQAMQEKRTAGNALGQSWCLLNDRACSEFMNIVRNSEYKYDIKPSAKIHDAQYYIVKASPRIIGFINKHLVKAVQWQDDPNIFHDKVKLGGEVSIFYPTWKDECVIPNGSEPKEIKEIFNEYKESLI